MTLQTVDEKIDSAVHAAMTALGLSVANCPDTADALNDAIGGIARNIITDDDDDEDDTPSFGSFMGITLPIMNESRDYTAFNLGKMRLEDLNGDVFVGIEVWKDDDVSIEICIEGAKPPHKEMRLLDAETVKKTVSAHLIGIGIPVKTIAYREDSYQTPFSIALVAEIK